MLTKFLRIGLMAALSFNLAGQALASGGEKTIEKHGHWAFTGVMGRYDKEAVQRGFQVYREVCASCHSIELVSFRNLGQKSGPYYLQECPAELGLPETTDCSNPNENPFVKQIASEYTITDGPDDGGDMFERPGTPADRIPGPYANSKAAAAANGGALPPDFSLLAKARHHGPDYIYSLMQGYQEAPEQLAIAPGTYYNVSYPGGTTSLLKDEYLDGHGHIIEGTDLPYGGAFKMAPPLSDGIVDYFDPATPETVEQYASDIVNFLAWASEPKMEQRKKMGLIVISYLLILAIILYLSMKQIWARVK